MRRNVHLSAAEILTVRDGEAGTVEDEGAAHLRSCARCRDALARARFRAQRIDAALPPGPELDPATLEQARARVRARLAPAGSSIPASSPPGASGTAGTMGGGHRWGLADLARAAGLILLLAGGAAALPGSPVRQWITSAFEEPAKAAAPAAVEAVPEAAVAGSAETGVRLRVAAGPVEVAVTGAGAGVRIEVERGEGAELAVFAPEGSRFRSAEGRVEVTAAGGPVRVRLPAVALPATVRVDGQVYLRWTRTGPEILGSVVERREGRIVFEVGG